jgi:hypothetical protein
LFGVANLPTPDRRTADTGPARHLLHRQPLDREHDDVHPLNMLERAVAVAEDRGQTRAILGSNDDA